MCFSATASFSASGILSAAGITTIRKAKPNERMYAALPFLFALQQFIEGFQWLAISSGEHSLVLSYLFLFFAFFLWPTYVPISIYLMEKSGKRKDLLKKFIIVGVACSLYFLIGLFKLPMFVGVLNSRIVYEIGLPFINAASFIYAIVTIGSIIISSHKMVRLFGVAAFVFAVIAIVLYTNSFTSVWCFFSAALSLIVLLHFYKFPKVS